MKILIIDDDVEICELLRWLLVKGGETTNDTFTAAITGEEGLHLAAQGGYGLILLDLELPGMNGLEVLEELRHIINARTTPVVILTGSANPNDLHRAFALGAEDFIHKPFDPQQLLVRVRAVSERRRLSDESARLALVVKHTGAAVFITDCSGVIDWINPAFTTLTGFSLSEAVGVMPTALLDSPQTDPKLIREIGTALQEGRRFEGELYYQCKSGLGRWFHVKIDPVFDDNGFLRQFVGVQTDISDRKSMDAALRESEQHMSLTFDAVAEGLVVKDGDGKIIRCNAAGEKILGLSFEQMAGMTPMDARWQTIREDGSHFPGEEHPAMVAMRTGEPVRDVVMGIDRPDGSLAWIAMNSVPLKDRDGRVTLVVSSFSDITARRQTEQELLKSRKFRALGEMVGGVAHEFNNLLQPMVIQLSVIRRDPDAPPSLIEKLQPVSDAVNNAVDLCQRVLAMGRTVTETHESISLGKLAHNTISLLGATIDSRIDVVLDIHPHTPQVWLPRSQLSQVIMNLCLNARDTLLEKLASRHPARWQPRFELKTTAVTREPSPRLGGGPSVLWGCVIVSDNGMGMSDEILARIFEPFFTTKTGSHGTGLGLAVIWNIVDSFKGWIDVQSIPGEGTTFTVYLPVDERTALPLVSMDGAESVQTPDGPRRILLVEDNEMVAKTFRAMLVSAGHQVHHVVDGESAWSILVRRHADFDMVVSDLMMPRINGMDLTRLIRQLPFRGRIVIISGYISKAQRSDLENLGVYRVLLKPVTPEALLAAVAQTPTV